MLKAKYPFSFLEPFDWFNLYINTIKATCDQFISMSWNYCLQNEQLSNLILPNILPQFRHCYRNVGTLCTDKTQCQRIYIKLTQFEDNDGRKLVPSNITCRGQVMSFWEMSKQFSRKKKGFVPMETNIVLACAMYLPVLVFTQLSWKYRSVIFTLFLKTFTTNEAETATSW